MSAELLLANAARYLAQTMLLVAVAELGFRAVRLRAPGMRLAVLQAVLLACVLLPFQRARRPAINGESGDGAVGVETRIASAVPHRPAVTLRGAVVGAAAGGTALRFLWLAAGLLRLRSRRRRARELMPVPEPIEAAERVVGVRSEYFLDPAASSPVAFGRSILLPPRFEHLTSQAQRAVIAHELVHVRRGHWYALLAEESARAFLWWNPGVWWLLERIQLAREQAVDQAVLEMGRDRRGYLGALLEMASVRLEPDLAPAPLFLRRRHLRDRVALIVNGGVMSNRRMKASLAFLSALLPVAAGLAMQLLPLQGAAQSDAPGVEFRSAVRVLHRSAVDYPAWIAGQGIAGDVVVEVRTDRKGNVTAAAATSGPDALRPFAVEAVRSSHFDPAQSLPERFEVTVRFAPPPDDGRLAADWSNPANQPPIRSIDFSRLPPELRDRVAAVFPVKPGDRPDPFQMEQAMRAAAAVDEHVAVGQSFGPNGERDMVVALRPPVADMPAPPAAAVDFPPDPNVKRVRVGGDTAALNLVRKVAPSYPAVAKQARVQGVVRLAAVIDREGNVKNLQLVSGHPLLAPSAVEAVKQWVYRPTLLNGDPVEVATTIDVNYTLLP